MLPEESEESSELSSPTSNCNNPFDPVSASPNSAAFVQQHQKKRLHKQQQQQQQQQQRQHQNSKSLDLLTGPSSSSPGSREHLHTTSSAHHLSRNISDPLSSFSPARSTSRPLVMSASASAGGGGGACSSTHSNSSEPSLYSSGTTLHALSRSDSDIEDIDKTDDEDDDRTFLECKQHPNTTNNNNSHNHVSSPTSKFCPTSPDSVRSSSCFESALGSPLSSSVYESPASPTSTASRYATPPPPPPQQATSPPSPQPQPQPPAQTSSAVNITASPFQSNGARSVFPTNRPPFSYPEE